MSIKTRLVAGAGALALAAGALAIAAPAAGADQTLVSCTGGLSYASLNPTLGSGDSRYTKSATKGADGTKHLSLTGAEDLGPTGVDALTCVVDPGIRTDNASSNSTSGKDNPYDNQSNGNAFLNIAKNVGTSSGSATCNAVDPSLVKLYPQTYPNNGKVVWIFTQTDALLHPIQIQQYIRLGLAFPLDPSHRELSISGTVIKGPGVGGDVHATIGFSPLYDVKGNLNAADCLASTAAKTASLKSLLVQGADGADAGTATDPWTITIPS